MERFAKQAAELLSPFLPHPIDAHDLETPPDSTLGDLGFPCFRLSKVLRKAPPAIAQEIAERVRRSLPSQWEVHPVGPYVNFKISPPLLIQTILKEILENEFPGTYGNHHSEQSTPDSKPRGVWVLEYSSPNIAKPFNFYHLRPTAIGAALDRMGKARGYKTISINHLGDWGTQYGKLAVAFQLFSHTLPSEPTIDDLVRIYVEFHKEVEKDPDLEVRAREAFKKLESGDAEITALWKRCSEISLKEFYRLYDLLGVHFDYVWGESFYTPQIPNLLKDLRKKGLLIESEGAWVVPLTDASGNEIPPCILEKSDGATIYATRDLAAAIYRHDRFQFDRMTYIVGSEQKLHFQQVFGVLKKMQLGWADRCEHIPFGLYRFKDAKMSTRKGNFLTFNFVLETAQQRVRELIEERQSADLQNQWDNETKEDTISKVALGALIFHDLHHDPVKDVEFDLERAVAFDGETGPYLQYAHTRCLGILKKAEMAELKISSQSFRDQLKYIQLNEPSELALLKTLGQFPSAIERSLVSAKPSQLAHFLIDVTKAFGAFYRDCQVISDDKTLSQSRLLLVEATRRILFRGLGFLGVPLPERM